MHRDTSFYKGDKVFGIMLTYNWSQTCKKLSSRPRKHIVQVKHHVELDVVIHTFNTSTWDLDKKSGGQGLLGVGCISRVRPA